MALQFLSALSVKGSKAAVERLGARLPLANQVVALMEGALTVLIPGFAEPSW